MPGLFKSLVLTLLLVFSMALSAQVSGIVNYTQEQGLNASYTYVLSQDRDGYIWIGSDNGLFRFDGVEFKNYNTKNGLRNIDVLQAFSLKGGEIFIAPFMTDFAYLRGDSLYTSQNNPELKKLSGSPASSFLLREDSLRRKLYIYEFTNPKQLFVYENDKVESRPIVIPASARLLDYSVVDYDFKDSMILCGVSGNAPNRRGVFKYNLRTHTLQRLENISIDSTMNSHHCYGHNFFCFVSEKAVQVFAGLLQPAKTIRFNQRIYWARMTGPSALWVSFIDGGVAYYDLGRDPGMKAPVMMMEECVLNDVLADRDGNVWFSTKDNGLFMMTRQSFNNYVRQPIRNNASYITGITANRNAIILAYNMGRGAIFRGNNQLQDLVLNDHIKYVNNLVLANDDKAVFGLGNTTFQVDLSNYKTGGLGFSNSHCKNLVPYTKESVLFCMSRALVEYNLTTGRSTQLLLQKTYSALPFDRDSLFVGSFKDLYKFNTVTKSKRLFLSGYYFTDLKRIGPDSYIGATNGNGLVLFNRHGVTRTITTTQGLANDQVKRIEVQDATTFWAATNSGLCRVYLRGDSLSVINFTRQDGLFSEKVTGCVIRRDTIYVGTARGLTILPIESLLNQPKYIVKKVLINSITIGHKTYPAPAPHHKAAYPENNVTFHLSFLDYASMGKVSYRYKIEGLSNGWQVSNSPKILLNALPPGRYVFKVYGLSYNGKRSYDCTELPFEIEPRFWQTWWFQGCVVLALCLSALLTVNRAVQKRRDKKLRSAIYEKKIAELELQALKAQINPHFIYNCLNSIQFLLYKKNYDETENYLEIFARMIRKTLHYSEKTFMPIGEEIEYLTLYLDMEKLRFKTRFRYTISAAGNVDPLWKIPSLLIQPFVENALKHGIDQLTHDQGLIEVVFEYAAPLLCVTVRDNGVGIASKLQTGNKLDSFGIRLSQKRIDTFKQLFHTAITFRISDLAETGGQGTEIKIYLNI